MVLSVIEQMVRYRWDEKNVEITYQLCIFRETDAGSRILKIHETNWKIHHVFKYNDSTAIGQFSQYLLVNFIENAPQIISSIIQLIHLCTYMLLPQD